MILNILILSFLVGKYEANPAATAINSIKSGARLASAVLRNKAVRRIKSGNEHISAALSKTDDADGILKKIKNFFTGM